MISHRTARRGTAAAVATLLVAGAALVAGSTGANATASSPTRTAAATSTATSAPRWHVGTPPLTTRWTHRVGPHNALPQYPRPELRRTQWRNLNGVWQFAGATAGEAPPIGQNLPERILVPYPEESALSGIQRHDDHMYYRRTFTVPRSWDIGRRHHLRLNFGAVDYRTTVWVNGHVVARHTGGYDQFSADVTKALTGSGPQEVVVGVEDKVDDTWQPLGKQRRVPDRGIFYTASSGIWQTVWMEPVARRSYVKALDMTPDIDSSTVKLDVPTGGPSRRVAVHVDVLAHGRVVSRTVGAANKAFRVRVPHERLWSPAHPYLYGLRVSLWQGRRVLDRVSSYVGMREIGTARGKDGKLHITLNHKILFLMSTLDQGFWPDGIYTAPTDQALASDIKATKRLGFNTIRKHIKVEPDRWYYHADRIGMLVWQDMPAMKVRFTPDRADDIPPPAAREVFEHQLHRMVAQHRSWTSIIGWIPFNEGWGEWNKTDTGRIADAVKRQDPSRLVDAHSGVNCCNSLGDSGRGDVIDWHTYTGPADPTPSATRVAIDGEHGGFGLEVPGHMWFDDGSAYQMADNKPDLTRLYVDNQDRVLQDALHCGISGAIYTQLTDVEHEVNGFYTYDRRVKKMNFAKVRAVNDKIVRDARGQGVPASSYPPGTPGLDGVHAYALDEDQGTVAHDSVGGDDATLTNATWVPGVDGSAVSFDGTGQGDTGASEVDTTGSYSVSAWVKLDQAGTDFQTVVSQDSDSGTSGFFLQYSGADQRWAMSFAGLRALSPQQPEAGRWYHLTGVRDAQQGTLSLYVDGRLASTQQACLGDPSTGDTVIGRGQFGGNQVDFLHGSVDDVRVFDRALSATEVAKLATPPGQ